MKILERLLYTEGVYSDAFQLFLVDVKVKTNCDNFSDKAALEIRIARDTA